jgi:hypothetical protein
MADKKAEDNLNYKDSKRLRKVESLAGLLNRKATMGDTIVPSDLELLSEQYMELKEKGADVSDLDEKINNIKKNYKINQKMIKKGKVPLEERLGKEIEL